MNLHIIDWPKYIEIGRGVATLPGSVFLDLGLFDIPATVTAAVQNAARDQNVEFISVHPGCVEAAIKGQNENGRPRIVVKTVLREGERRG